MNEGLTPMSSLKKKGGEKQMKPTVPTRGNASAVLGKTTSIAHASKCGTCACKCACRYNDVPGDNPFEK